MPKDFAIGNFGHPVSKSWLRLSNGRQLEDDQGEKGGCSVVVADERREEGALLW